jgi:hypothetical protein
MVNIFESTPIETDILEITESGDRFLYLFFIYTREGQHYWRLTSKIQRIKFAKRYKVFRTKKSQYHLSTTNIVYNKISLTEFLYCRLGHTPNESKVLAKQKGIHKDI